MPSQPPSVSFQVRVNVILNRAFSCYLYCSQEVVNDHTSAKTIQEEPVTTYCKNGCQGACACPVLDFQRTLTSSEPVLRFPVSSQPEVSTHLPPPEDIPPTDPLPEIPKESQSSLHRKSSHKNALQTLKEKFVKRDSLDAGSERRGSGSQGRQRRRSLFGKKTSISGSELEGNESRNEIASEQLRSADWARRGSRRRKSSKQVNKRGSNKEINKDRRSKEVNKRGSNKEVDRIDKIRSENVGKQESKTGSLKLLRGMMSFKRTTSSHKQKIHAAE